MKNRPNKKIPVILNCDTGIDDAVAILIAVKTKKLDVKLITTNVGNVEPVRAAKNTLNVLDLIDAPDIPVVNGDSKCFKKERAKVAVHGEGGLGDYVFDETKRQLKNSDAVQEMYDVLMSSDKKVTIVCLSPTTNIARLVTKHKDCLDKIERVVLMAGTIEEISDNEMPYPEFNIASDPEAGEALLNCGVRVDIVPMEMGHTAYLDWQDVFKTKVLNYTGSVLEVVYRSYRDRHVKNGIATHDGCAIAYITNPELFEVKPVNAQIKYFDSIKTGVLTMDFHKEPNCLTCTKVNISKFKNLYYKCLRKCK